MATSNCPSAKSIAPAFITCRLLTCRRPLRATRSRATSSIAALMSTPVTRKSAGSSSSSSPVPTPTTNIVAVFPRRCGGGARRRQPSRMERQVENQIVDRRPTAVGGLSARLGAAPKPRSNGHQQLPFCLPLPRLPPRSPGRDPTTSDRHTPAAAVFLHGARDVQALAAGRSGAEAGVCETRAGGGEESKETSTRRLTSLTRQETIAQASAVRRRRCPSPLAKYPQSSRSAFAPRRRKPPDTLA